VAARHPKLDPGSSAHVTKGDAWMYEEKDPEDRKGLESPMSYSVRIYAADLFVGGYAPRVVIFWWSRAL
jgi:hypothetical protein